MTNDQSVRVLFLFGIGAMEVLSKTGLDAGAVLEELLCSVWECGCLSAGWLRISLNNEQAALFIIIVYDKYWEWDGFYTWIMCYSSYLPTVRAANVRLEARAQLERLPRLANSVPRRMVWRPVFAQ